MARHDAGSVPCQFVDAYNHEGVAAGIEIPCRVFCRIGAPGKDGALGALRQGARQRPIQGHLSQVGSVSQRCGGSEAGRERFRGNGMHVYRRTRIRGSGARRAAAAATIGEQLFIVRIDHDTVTVSADSSGALLHKRGYRQATAKAPMRETLAAAMLLSSGWRRDQPLVDPLCGSGTIPIEAALIARNIAPGINREFRFERWPGFDRTAWETLRGEALAGASDSVPASILASDRDAGAIAATMSNAVRTGVGGDVQIAQQSLSATSPTDRRSGWLITNPPYGVRLGTDVRNLYARLGSMMRTSFAGWNLGILSADAELDRQLGIPLERMFETKNGGIAIRFLVGRAQNEQGNGGFIKHFARRRAQVASSK